MHFNNINYSGLDFKSSESKEWFSSSNFFEVRDKLLEINQYVKRVNGLLEMQPYCGGWWEAVYINERFSEWGKREKQLSWPLFRISFCKEIIDLLSNNEKHLPIFGTFTSLIYKNYINKTQLTKILKEFYSLESDTSFWNTFMNPHSSIPRDVNLKLPVLVSTIRESILTLSEIDADQNTPGDSYILNKKIFENLSQHTQNIVQKLSICYEKHVSQLRPNPNYFLFYKNVLPFAIEKLVFFNCWFDPNAVVSLHGFDLRFLKAAQKSWDDILGEIETIHFWYLIRIVPEVQGLIALYHYHIQASLKQLRGIAIQAQIEQVTLKEQLISMEKSIGETNISDKEIQAQITVVLQRSKQDVIYQQALNQIAAVFSKYNKNFQIEIKKLSPATRNLFRTVAELSDIKIIKKPPEIALPDSQEQKNLYPEENHPIISLYLLDFAALKSLNEKTMALLVALERTSFWRAKNEKIRNQFIFLIKNFNNCFSIENLKDEIRLERANICLQDLMDFIQHFPDLGYWVEDEFYIYIELGPFIKQYAQTIRETLTAVQRQYVEIQTSSLTLRKKIKVLEDQIKGELTTPLDLKKSVHEKQPYKQALVKIAGMILSAEMDYPSNIIPSIIMILKHSYEGLDRKNKVDQETQPLSAQLTTYSGSFERLPPVREQKIAVTDESSWKLLKLIYQYSHIVESKYTSYNPADSWPLWWTGATDRLGSIADRQSQYIQFCTRLRPLLGTFNKNFSEMTSSSVEEKVVDKANRELLQIEDAIQSSISGGDGLSYAFYKLCQDVKDDHKKNNSDRSFLGWQSLKNLNQSSQKILEIDIWKDVRNGHLTVDSLLTGAIKLFKNNFTSEALRGKKGADKTFSTNPSLLYFMQLLYNYFTCYGLIPDENRFQLLPFILQYNRYVLDRIAQLRINIHRRAFQNRLLVKKITDLQENKTFDYQARLWLQKRIQTIVRTELNQEFTGKQVLLQIAKLIVSQKDPVFVKIGTLIQEVKIPSPLRTTQQEAKAPVLLPEADLKANAFLNAQFLDSFSEKMNSLLALLADHPDAKQQPIAHYIGLIQDFKQCQFPADLSRADDDLQSLVREITHDINLYKYNESISWPLYLFIVNYSILITRFLQHLWRVDDEHNQLAKKFTAQIDEIQNKNNDQLDRQSLIQHIIESEKTGDEPHQQIVRTIAHTIFESSGQINAEQFTALKPVLKSIFSIFGQSRKENDSSEKTLECSIGK